MRQKEKQEEREKGVRKEERERKRSFIFLEGNGKKWEHSTFFYEHYFPWSCIFDSFIVGFRFSKGAKSEMIWKCRDQGSESLSGSDSIRERERKREREWKRVDRKTRRETLMIKIESEIPFMLP